MKHSTTSLLPLGALLSLTWQRLLVSLPKLGLLLIIQLVVYGIFFALFMGLLFTAGLSMLFSPSSMESFRHVNGNIFFIGSALVFIGISITAAFVHICEIRIIQSSGKLSLTTISHHSLPLLLGFFILQLVSLFFLFGGFFLLVLPVFFIFFFFAFAVFALVCDGYSPMRALQRSVTLVAAYPFEILLRFVLLWILLVCVGALPHLIFQQSGTVSFFLSTMLSLFLSWYTLAYLYELYVDVSVKAGPVHGKILRWFFVAAVAGWLLLIGVGIYLYELMASGRIEEFIRADMRAENRAEYRPPGEDIQFAPSIELKES